MCPSYAVTVILSPEVGMLQRIICTVVATLSHATATNRPFLPLLPEILLVALISTLLKLWLWIFG